jgi:hypothetical protein
LLKGVFYALVDYSVRHRPGSVNGLARDHAPYGGSWASDALDIWLDMDLPATHAPPPPTGAAFGIHDLITALHDDVPDEVLKQILSVVDADPSVDANHLVQVIAPFSDRLTGDGEFKALRQRAIRHRKRLADDAANAPSTQLTPAWPWWSFTGDRRAVMVGGDNRTDAQERLQQHFGFAELDWDTGWETRRTHALAERIRGGTVDLVVLVRRFLKHSTSGLIVPACKDAKVPFVTLGTGYGGSQIQRAIEEQLDAVHTGGS